MQSNRELNLQLANAAYEGRLAEVKELIEKKGADINSKVLNNRTPVIHAACYGKKDIVEYLLRQKANLTIRAEYNRSLLMIAAGEQYESSLAIFKAILNENPNVNDTDEDNKSALTYALAHGGYKHAALLLNSKANVNGVGLKNLSPLIQVTQKTKINIRMLNKVLNLGANVNVTNDKGLKPIQLAAENPEAVRLLLKHGALQPN
jgi:ankyrin repeat protein